MRHLAWLFVVACAKQADVSEPTVLKDAELNALMNERINPAFSKLSFLVFHADTMDDPEAARRELVVAADNLSAGTSVLSGWRNPPVSSAQGREVFHTYSANVDRYAKALVTAVRADDDTGSARALEQIATTCNNCHHFFRLDIKDSVVGPQAK